MCGDYSEDGGRVLNSPQPLSLIFTNEIFLAIMFTKIRLKKFTVTLSFFKERGWG
jgi:hypothetical protein